MYGVPILPIRVQLTNEQKGHKIALHIYTVYV